MDPGGELMTAPDAELGEGVREVVLDGFGAQVQVSGGLTVGQPGRHQPRGPFSWDKKPTASPTPC